MQIGFRRCGYRLRIQLNLQFYPFCRSWVVQWLSCSCFTPPDFHSQGYEVSVRRKPLKASSIRFLSNWRWTKTPAYLCSKRFACVRRFLPHPTINGLKVQLSRRCSNNNMTLSCMIIAWVCSWVAGMTEARRWNCPSQPPISHESHVLEVADHTC